MTPSSVKVIWPNGVISTYHMVVALEEHKLDTGGYSYALVYDNHTASFFGQGLRFEIAPEYSDRRQK